jgi:hypothetical protein
MGNGNLRVVKFASALFRTKQKNYKTSNLWSEKTGTHLFIHSLKVAFIIIVGLMGQCREEVFTGIFHR